MGLYLGIIGKKDLRFLYGIKKRNRSLHRYYGQKRKISIAPKAYSEYGLRGAMIDEIICDCGVKAILQ